MWYLIVSIPDLCTLTYFLWLDNLEVESVHICITMWQNRCIFQNFGKYWIFCLTIALFDVKQIPLVIIHTLLWKRTFNTTSLVQNFPLIRYPSNFFIWHVHFLGNIFYLLWRRLFQLLWIYALDHCNSLFSSGNFFSMYVTLAPTKARILIKHLFLSITIQFFLFLS